MKVLKYVLLGILAIFAVLLGISYTKVSKTSTSKLKDAFSGVLGNISLGAITGNSAGTTAKVASTKANTSATANTTKTPTVTATSKVNVDDYLGIKYEGEAIYSKYNGIAKKDSDIGYLANGTLLTLANAMLVSGNYKRRFSSAGVDYTTLINIVTVSGTNDVSIYGKRNGTYTTEGEGFMEDGTIVYRRFFNEGTPEEYAEYYT